MNIEKMSNNFKAKYINEKSKKLDTKEGRIGTNLESKEIHQFAKIG